MRTQAQILNVSYDALLLQTRSAILHSAGYAVIPANTFSQALKLLQRCAFDLVVIGHSLPTGDTCTLLAAVRALSTPVLLLTRGSEGSSGEADLVLPAIDGPRALLTAVGRLLHGRLKRVAA